MTYTVNAWAAPSVANSDVGIWGPWNHSGGIIATANTFSSQTLNFETISDGPSTYNVEVRYFNGTEMVVQTFPILGSGGVTINVGGGENGSLSTVSFRLQSSSLGQLVTVDTGSMRYYPGSAEIAKVMEDNPDGAADSYLNALIGDMSSVIQDVQSKITTSITSAYDNFMSAIANSIRKDPLIIDMGGNGLQLNSWQESGVQFDMDGNGTPENTGWVKSAASGGDDAFLVIDKNGNGNVDGVDELFGNNTNTGFEELRKYDSNGDNVINSSDTQFNLLKLWKDADADGVVDAANDNSIMQRMVA